MFTFPSGSARSVALTLLVALSGCGPDGTVTEVQVTEDDGTHTVLRGADGSSITVDVGTFADELGVPLPEGARIDPTSVVTLTTKEGTTRTATYRAAASPQELVAFYEKQFELDVSLVSAEGGSLIATPTDTRTISIGIGELDADGLREVIVSVIDTTEPR